VKISDSAVVSAVDLWVKYLTDRNLPDKAIDLIDEAAASVKMWIISVPESVVKLEKQIKNLEIEKEALNIELKNWDDQRKSTRIQQIETELIWLKEKFNILNSEREDERKLLFKSKEIKEKLQKLEHEA
jgi:ATP-dependent Clp protease ATP-binding subunit ClpB